MKRRREEERREKGRPGGDREQSSDEIVSVLIFAGLPLVSPYQASL